MCMGGGYKAPPPPAAPVQLPPAPTAPAMAPTMLQSTPKAAVPQGISYKKKGKRSLTIPPSTPSGG